MSLHNTKIEETKEQQKTQTSEETPDKKHDNVVSRLDSLTIEIPCNIQYSDNTCNKCNVDFMFKMNPDFSHIVFGEILFGNNHVHCAEIHFKSKPVKKVVFKTTKNSKHSNLGSEYDMLTELNNVFSKSVQKPMLSTLASQLNTENNEITICMLRGPIDLFEYANTNSVFFAPKDPFLKMALVQSITRCMIEKIGMLHANSIAHLDLSVENVLFADNEAFLIDFEFSKKLDHTKMFHFYPNPDNEEIFGKLRLMSTSRYRQHPWNGFKEDVFAIGIILFILCFGFEPFEDHCDRGAIMIQNGKTYEYVQLCGSEYVNRLKLREICLAVNLINLCCSFDRPDDATELLQHPFLLTKK